MGLYLNRIIFRYFVFFHRENTYSLSSKIRQVKNFAISQNLVTIILNSNCVLMFFQLSLGFQSLGTFWRDGVQGELEQIAEESQRIFAAEFPLCLAHSSSYQVQMDLLRSIRNGRGVKVYTFWVP